MNYQNLEWLALDSKMAELQQTVVNLSLNPDSVELGSQTNAVLSTALVKVFIMDMYASILRY